MKLNLPKIPVGHEDSTGFHVDSPIMEHYRNEERAARIRQTLFVIAMCCLTLAGGILGYIIGRIRF